MLSPSLIFLFFVVIFPLAFAYYVSTTIFPLFEFKVIKFVGLDQYITLFTDSRFWHSQYFTAIFTVSAVAIEFVLGLALALLFDREIRGGRMLRTLILTPMLIAPIVVSMVWKYILHPSVGLVDYLLGSIGLYQPAWLSTKPYALIAVVIIDVWEWTPFMFLVLSAGLASIPREPYEAALVDGASKLGIFRYVTLPLLKPIIFIAILLRAMDALKIFDILFVTTKGGPGIYTESLTYHIYNLALNRRIVGRGCAASIIVVFIVFGIFSFYLKYKPKVE